MLGWLYWHLGINGSGPYYGFWSGFGSDLAEFAIVGGIATGLYTFLRKHNCHTTGCWRVGLRHTAAGDIVCHRHHPEGRLTHADIIARHHAAKAAITQQEAPGAPSD